MAHSTRDNTSIFGLGSGITAADAEITGSRLPTNEQVVRCYMFHQREGAAQGTTSNRTKRDNANLVLQQIIPYYLKGNIPMITECRAVDKIVELFQKNSKT